MCWLDAGCCKHDCAKRSLFEEDGSLLCDSDDLYTVMRCRFKNWSSCTVRCCVFHSASPMVPSMFCLCLMFGFTPNFFYKKIHTQPRSFERRKKAQPLKASFVNVIGMSWTCMQVHECRTSRLKWQEGNVPRDYAWKTSYIYIYYVYVCRATNCSSYSSDLTCFVSAEMCCNLKCKIHWITCRVNWLAGRDFDLALMSSSSNALFVSGHHESYVTQSGLISILKKVREHGLPDNLSRRSVKRTRDSALPTTTLGGPFWTEVEIELVNGRTKKYPMLAPMSMLSHLCSECDGFATFFARQLQRHPVSESSAWQLAIYSDEILPGNALKPNNERKLLAIYWSCLEFDEACSDEDMWFHCMAVRTSEVKLFKSGVGQLLKKVLEKFAEHPFAMDKGVHLRVKDLAPVMFFARPRLLVGDEVALKNSLSFKGAAGSIPCFLCRNICQHGSDLATFDTSGFLVPHTDLNQKHWRLHTQESILEVIGLLKRQKPALGKGAFEKLEQSLGISYQSEGALFCDNFHSRFPGGPAACMQYDWMHTYLVGGIMNHEVGYLMEALASFPLSYLVWSFTHIHICFIFLLFMFWGVCISLNNELYKSARVRGNKMVHEFISSFTWPKRWSSAGTTGKNVFSKRSSKSEDLKCSASEGLSVYPVLRLCILRHIPNFEALADYRVPVKSFFALCAVLDILKKTFAGPVDPTELGEAVKTHLQLRLAAYGPERFQPKCHYALHLDQHLREHPRLLSCFCHERKHKQLKRFANDTHNANKSLSFERGLLQEVALLQITQLKEDQLKLTCSLKEPKPASDVFTQQIKMLLGMGPCDQLDLTVSYDAFLGPSELCSANDVVLAIDGSQKVGEVWFHFHAQGNLYTVWAPWTPVKNSPNMFTICDSPEILRTTFIKRCLVFRKDGDQALVVPWKCAQIFHVFWWRDVIIPATRELVMALRFVCSTSHAWNLVPPPYPFGGCFCGFSGGLKNTSWNCPLEFTYLTISILYIYINYIYTCH